MAIDPEIASVLKALESMKPMETMTLEELRASMAPVPLDKRKAVADVTDFLTGDGIRLRRYTPLDLRSDKFIVYFHGGGFVIGDLETHDHLCRDLADACRSVVVAVDYRRSPEFRFPIPANDCLQALRWITANRNQIGVGQRQIVLAGDSAGATLAAVTSLRWQNEAGTSPLAGQILAYPVTNYHSPPTSSYLENAKGYSLTRNAMVRFWADYVISPEEAQNPCASPLLAPDVSISPPTLLMTAQFDPLRDEGDAYAERLIDSGVPVRHLKYDGLIHGFLRMSLVSQRARDAFVDIADWFGKL